LAHSYNISSSAQLDLLNHDLNGCNAALHVSNQPTISGGCVSVSSTQQAREDASSAPLCMSTIVPIGAGEEILQNYGAKSSISQLLTYGFCMWSNPDEKLALPVPLIQEALDMVAPVPTACSEEEEEEDGLPAWRSELPIRQLRADLEATLDAEEGSTWNLSHSKPIPDALVGLAYAQAMGEPEYRAMLQMLPHTATQCDTQDQENRQAFFELLTVRCLDSSRPEWQEATAEAALDGLDELFYTTWGLTVSLLDLPELHNDDGQPANDGGDDTVDDDADADADADAGSGGGGTGVEDAGARFEALCDQAKAVDSVKVGVGEYSVTPRGCQLALLQSQLAVLMSAMDALRERSDNGQESTGEGAAQSDSDDT
jgi:hypothetical protein